MTDEPQHQKRSRRLQAIAEAFRKGDIAALAQTITLVEQGGSASTELLGLLPTGRASAPTVGFTGPPGAGKSTLVAATVRLLRSRGLTVAVLAVDPSSPFTRGAFLGDRVRLSGHNTDPGVFVRSMGARGHSGGLSRAAADAIWVLRSFGFDEVLVESVGVGQSELALKSVVDTTVVLVPPDAGDQIQMAKAGIMEIADVFVVNKGDLPGARRTAGDLRSSVRLTTAAWRPPVIVTVANSENESHELLWQEVKRHRGHLGAPHYSKARSRTATIDTVAELVGEQARDWTRNLVAQDGDLRAAVERGVAPSLVAEDVCRRLGLAPELAIDRSASRQ